MLRDDPTCAVTAAGPILPLVHLCRSRMFTVWPDKADNCRRFIVHWVTQDTWTWRRGF
jgi:hypothetical protein